jgi:hypothetical protein
MTAVEALGAALAGGDEFQRPINAFVDAFRRASSPDRAKLVREPVEGCGPLQGLVAATVSALCREVNLDAPGWVDHALTILVIGPKHQLTPPSRGDPFDGEFARCSPARRRAW